MSFLFPSWVTAFTPSFHEDAKGMLETALNKGNKPPVIQGHIEVVELSMGKEPPTLTLLEIGDLSLDRFRGILRLGYAGDAWLEVRCRVQANPLSHNPNLLPSSILPLSTPLLASQPLLVPMTLRLSKLHLRAILILVVSASKGITLVFKNDPLQNVDVSSTFDSIEVIRGYLQQEIEGQLREMFREDLPGIIHRLSQRWFTGTAMSGRVDTPYKDPDPLTSTMTQSATDEDDDEMENPFSQRPIFPPRLPTSSPSDINLTPRRKATQKPIRERRSSTAASESPTSYTVFRDIEDYDPTYGLRPQGLPTHSGYEAFGRLWEKAREGETRGLGGLMGPPILEEMREPDVDELEEDENTEHSVEMVEISDSLRNLGTAPLTRRPTDDRSIATSSRYGEEDEVEWETFPAVGGGVISRPRVYHSQSLIRAPSDAGFGSAMPSPADTAAGGSVTARASSIGGASSTIGSLRMLSRSQSALPAGRATVRPAAAGPGPSSLRRAVTSKSDVFLASYQAPRAVPSAQAPIVTRPDLYRSSSLKRPPTTETGTSSSVARTSGSSWNTSKGPTQSTSASTLPSTQQAPMTSVSVEPKQIRTNLTHQRAASFAGSSPGTSFPPRHIGPGGITLPLNNSVSQLAMLSNSYHTLSPYARGHEHIAVRSYPHLGKSHLSNTGLGSASLGGPSRTSSSGGETGVVKPKRKRLYRLNTNTLGGKSSQPADGGEGYPDPGDQPLDDLHDSPPSLSPEGSSKRPSTSSASSDMPQQRLASSLTGVAQRVMQAQSKSSKPSRPNIGRSPDSRTSYGFPSLSRFGSIAE